MRRPALILGIVIACAALAAPAIAANGYRGETEAGGLLAIRAKFNGHGDPTKAYALRWANIPATCRGYPPTADSGDIKLSMKVDDHGRFDGSGKAYFGAKVTISGRFSKNAKKASGTFRIKGQIAACSDADTGSLDWDMNRK